MSRDEELSLLAALLGGQRWAALATLEEGLFPYASAVAYACEPDLSGLLMHLSRLAPHTRNLLASPRASLLITTPDSGGEEPQALPRVSLLGAVTPLEKGSTEWERAKGRYLERLPAAAERFDFPDFLLFRFVPTEARWVGGFARARRFDAAALREAARHAGEAKE